MPPAAAQVSPPELPGLLARAVQKPALPTQQWVLKSLMARVADVFVKLLTAHAAAETTAATKTGAEARREAVHSGRLLWIAASLMLRPGRQKAQEGQRPEGFVRHADMKQRVAAAELGDWENLLQEYLEEYAERDEARKPWHPAMAGQHERQQRTIDLMNDTKGIGRAKQTLIGEGALPPTKDTAAEVAELVAVPIQPEDREDTRQAVAEIRASASRTPLPKLRTVKRRSFLLNTTA